MPLERIRVRDPERLILIRNGTRRDRFVRVEYELGARRGNAGHLVFVTSVSSELTSMAMGEYCVFMVRLSMAAQLFAAGLAEEGIEVTQIRPGIIATDMTSGGREKYDRLMHAGALRQRRG